MSFGLEGYGPAGEVTLSRFETFPRRIDEVRKAHTFAGTFSVPNYDDTRGPFYVVFDAFKHTLRSFENDAVTQEADWVITTNAFNVVDRPSTMMGVNVFSQPTLTWNNSTKVMTVAAPTYENNQRLEPKVDYIIHFIHLG